MKLFVWFSRTKIEFNSFCIQSLNDIWDGKFVYLKFVKELLLELALCIMNEGWDIFRLLWDFVKALVTDFELSIEDFYLKFLNYFGNFTKF